MRTVAVILATVAVAWLSGDGSAAAEAPDLPAARSARTAEVATSGAPAGPAGFARSAAAPPPAVTGGFVLPLPPPAPVLTPFRPPATRYGTGHRGVDLAAAAGAEVRAAAGGTVVYAGMLAGRGVVSVQHPDGLRTTYEPVAASVTAGQRVTAGEVIGRLAPGHPPCSPRDCLHWGARLPDGSYLDPMSLLRPWHVRLKPWDPG